MKSVIKGFQRSEDKEQLITAAHGQNMSKNELQRITRRIIEQKKQTNQGCNQLIVLLSRDTMHSPTTGVKVTSSDCPTQSERRSVNC